MAWMYAELGGGIKGATNWGLGQNRSLGGGKSNKCNGQEHTYRFQASADFENRDWLECCHDGGKGRRRRRFMEGVYGREEGEEF